MSSLDLRSPWIEQINRTRSSTRLRSDISTSVAVVGAGIAGVTTAYFLLTKTWKTVALFEADRVAHGATGHNAGQLVSYFERPFRDIADEFGLAMAGDGQRAVESGWNLLEDMRRDLRLTTPLQIFRGYAGCMDMDEIVQHLEDNAAQAKAGLSVEIMLVSATAHAAKKIPKHLRSLCKFVPHETILAVLESNDNRYVAALARQKGCLNSARFSEEAVTALLRRYPHRLRLFEHTPIDAVRLYRRHAELASGRHIVRARRVVLCTNGFERLHIENFAGADIDVKFHHMVRGIVGYMAAFTESPIAPPAAISYFPAGRSGSGSAYDAQPYYYLTRRPYATAAEERNLVCIAGPEAAMDDTNDYSRAHPYPAEAQRVLKAFLRTTYRHTGRRLHFTHLWHGLMGYTPNGLRCVGPEPCNPVLMYNLGCNGVGILPSLYGSWRIAQLIKGKKLAPSIFDPADQRCMLPGRQAAPVVVASDKWISRHAIWSFVTFWTVLTAALLATYWIKYGAPLNLLAMEV